MPSFGNHATASVAPESLNEAIRLATVNLEEIRLAMADAKKNGEQELTILEDKIALTQKKLSDLNTVYAVESERIEHALKVIQADEVAAKARLDKFLQELVRVENAVQNETKKLQLVTEQHNEVHESLLSKIHEHEKLSSKYDHDVAQYKATVLELQGKGKNLAQRIIEQEGVLAGIESAILDARTVAKQAEDVRLEVARLKGELTASVSALDAVNTALGSARRELERTREITKAERERSDAAIAEREQRDEERQKILGQRELSLSTKLQKMRAFKEKLSVEFPDRILHLDL